MTQNTGIFSFQRLSRIALALSFFVGTKSSADPGEVREQQVVRTVAQGDRVTTTLSQNLYRTEVIEVPYTERVPYTVTVPYQDWEEYWDTEYRCHDVTRYREECRNETRYRQECRDEQKCYIVPGDGPRCRDVQECGTNARGERICKTRRVCEGGSSGRRECRNERTCRNVPYTDRFCRSVPYTDRQCQNERVRKTRSVTRYREETRYRDETRCCRSETRRVFDRQAIANVELLFDTPLKEGEQEYVRLSLVQAEPIDVAVDVQSPLFNYTVVRKDVSGSNVVIQLHASSKMNADTAGAASVLGVGLDQNTSSKEWSFSVRDTLVGPRWMNSYELILTEENTSREVLRQMVSADASGVIRLILGRLEVTGPLRAELKVRRQSDLLPDGGVLEFSKTSRFDRPRLSSEGLAQLKDRMQVQIVDAVAAGVDTSFGLQDLTPNYDDVRTSYRVVLSQVLSNDTSRIAEKTYERSALGALPAKIQFSDIMTPAQMNQWLRRGIKIQIWVIAKRVSSSPLLREELKLERSKNLEF